MSQADGHDGLSPERRARRATGELDWDKSPQGASGSPRAATGGVSPPEASRRDLRSTRRPCLAPSIFARESLFSSAQGVPISRGHGVPSHVTTTTKTSPAAGSGSTGVMSSDGSGCYAMTEALLAVNPEILVWAREDRWSDTAGRRCESGHQRCPAGCVGSIALGTAGGVKHSARGGK